MQGFALKPLSFELRSDSRRIRTCPKVSLDKFGIGPLVHFEMSNPTARRDEKERWRPLNLKVSSRLAVRCRCWKPGVILPSYPLQRPQRLRPGPSSCRCRGLQREDLRSSPISGERLVARWCNGCRSWATLSLAVMRCRVSHMPDDVVPSYIKGYDNGFLC